MLDALRTGVFAGIVAALTISLIETTLAFIAVSSGDVPYYGIILMPLFNFALLLPAGALVGGGFGLWHRCWHIHDTIGLGQLSRNTISDFKKGSLTILGWFWGLALLIGAVGLAGTLLNLYFDVVFHNRMLAGLLLTIVVCIVALFFGGPIRYIIGLLGALIARLRLGRNAPWWSSQRLAIVTAIMVVGGLAVFSYVYVLLLIDIGISLLLWLLVLLVVMGTAFVGSILTAPRWQSLPRIGRWLIILPIGGLVFAFGLGEIAAVRQASLNSETPATQVATVYRALSDLDGDGASSFFGGNDCEPFNSAIGPYAEEIPRNGIDDNCVGGDLGVSIEGTDHALINEKAFSPLPDDFPKRPNLILITIDALRADHVGFFGYKRNITPQIDRHAKQAVVFKRAYGQGTGTITSLPSLFTSKFFYQLKYVDNRMPPAISPRETTLAEHLKAAGYTTLGVTQLFYTFDSRWQLTQGFDHIDKTLAYDKPTASSRITSPQTLEIALKLLERGRRGKKPFFLWVHFYDPHSRYRDHPKLKSFGDRLIDKYDTEILFTDGYVGKFLDAVREPNQSPTVTLLTADHGDGFRSDRGRSGHGYGLYNEIIHVPMMV